MRRIPIDHDAAARNINDFVEAVNTASVATQAASAENEFWCLDWIVWSYNDNPTGGRLTVVFGSTTLLDIDITVGGPGEIRFDEPLMHLSSGAPVTNEALVVTLYAGGAAVVGKVSARLR